ncbi:PAS domain S-box-containing protein [Mesobacillus foraminis]|uniref:PAS domain S-box-containing protein n=2 Tax=Mesobacillus foraminis TaxID=279826 RepID=A0A4R2BBU2_9BACI|nr:PAS domain S-box-containing protein [Mesobacillus foraminis]
MREMYSSIVENIKSAIMVIDPQNMVVSVNQQCEKLLKVNREDILYKDIFQAFPDAPEEVRHIENAMKYEQEYVVDVMPYKWGPYNAYFTLQTKLLYEDGLVVGAMAEFSDITKYIEREAALKKSVEEMAANLVPISCSIAVLPLTQPIVSELEPGYFIEKVLTSVHSLQITKVILDVTAIYEADANFYDSITLLARGMKLIGKEMILTGFRPQVAKQMAAMGVNLRGIEIYPTLKRAMEVY